MAKNKLPLRLARNTVHTGKWLDLHIDRVQLPGGRIAEEYYQVEVHWSGVGALVSDEQGRVLLIRSPRYSTGRMEWEIPAGANREGESIEATAVRETLEEAGWQVQANKIIYSYNPLIGISNHRFHLVHCDALKQAGKFDRNESAGIDWKTPMEIAGMLKHNEINDGMTLTALTLWVGGLILRISDSAGFPGGA